MLIQLLVAGLAMGAIYGLVSLGFVLVINAANVINFAQGEFVMLGAFLIYTLASPEMVGLPFPIAFVAVVAIGAAVGFVFERTTYRPLRNKDVGIFLVSTLAASVVIANLAQQIWGTTPYSFSQPFGNKMIQLGNVSLVPQNLLILAFTVVLCIGLYLFFSHTRSGVMMRAAAQDRGAARLIGIRVSHFDTMAFVLSTAVGCLAGVLVAPIFFVTLDFGFLVGLKAFVAGIVGGWGSVPGAMAGGLLIGLVEVLATAYLSSAYKDAFAFLILILFLVLRPQGIFGEKVAVKV